MKRKSVLTTLMLVLSLGIVLGFASCGGSDQGGEAAESESAGIAGEWKLESAEIDGQTIDKSQLEGSDYSIILGADGKAKVSVIGQSYDAVNYTIEDGTIQFDREGLSSFTFKLDGDQIVCEGADGVKLTFAKQ